MKLLRRVFWRLLLAAAACAETASGSCLPNAIRPERLFTFQSPHGRSTPIGIFRGNWPSSMIASEIFKILLEEQVGYTANFTGTGNSMDGAYAVAGCTGTPTPPDYAAHCTDRWSDTHIFLNFLGTSEDQLRLEYLRNNVSRSKPKTVGEIGYVMKHDAFLKKSVQLQAFATNGLSLDFWQSLTLTSKSPEQFFDKVSDNKFKSFLIPCDDPDSKMNDPAVISKYLNGEGGGDIDGSVRNTVVANEGTLEEPPPVYVARCWGNLFWRAPGACRSDHLKCIPLITKNTEAFEAYMQKATALGLPFAIGVATDGNFSSMPSQFTALFDGIRPRRDNDIGADMIPLIFPEADPADWYRGNRGAAHPEIPVMKLVHQDMERYGRRVYDFAGAFELYRADIEEMVGRFLAGGTTYHEIACEFVKENTAFFQPLVPLPTTCESGFGLISDMNGTDTTGKPLPYRFEANRSDADGCAACEPGRFSDIFADHRGTTHRCTKCPSGKVQAHPGETSCTACDPGEYSQKTLRGCDVCDRSHYQPLAGQTSCLRCPENMVTVDIGAKSISDCVCEENLFYPCVLPGGGLRPGCNCSRSMYHKEVRGQNTNCMACPEHMSCEVGSTEQNMPCGAGDDQERGPYPKPMAGYYTEHKDPYSIYKCFHEKACPGGGIQSCSSNAYGIACGICDEGYWRRAGECRKCTMLEKSTGWIPVFMLVSVTCFAILYKLDSREVQDWNSPWHRFCSSCYAILVFLQTIDLCVSPFPLLMVRMGEKYDWTGPLSYLSLLQLRRAQCLTSPAFSDFYLLAISVPWVFIPCFAINYLFFVPVKHLRLEFSIMFNIWGSLCKTLFLTNTIHVLQYFSSYLHPNGQRSLPTFQEVLFESSEHDDMFLLAILASLLNVIAPFVAACVVFRVAPNQFHKERFRNWTKFLLINMRPSVYWWALIVLSKAIYIGMAVVVFEAQESIHAALMNGMVVYLAVYFTLHPWRSDIVSRMDSAMHVMLCMMIALVPFTFRKADQDPGSLYSDQDALSMMFVVVFYSTLLATLVAIGAMTQRKIASGQERQRVRCEALAIELCKTFECMTDEKVLVDVMQEMASADYETITDCVNLLQGEMFAVRSRAPRLVWRLQGKLPRDNEDHSRLYGAEAVWT